MEEDKQEKEEEKNQKKKKKKKKIKKEGSRSHVCIILVMIPSRVDPLHVQSVEQLTNVSAIAGRVLIEQDAGEMVNGVVHLDVSQPRLVDAL